MWNAPREVRVDEGGGTSEAVCVDGTSYDLTLLVPGRSRSLRRACDSAEIGEVADALEPALQAAMGHEPRFDVIFRGSASFASARSDYRELLASGGRLKPSPIRARAPGAEPMPPPETDASATAPAASTPAAPSAAPH